MATLYKADGKTKIEKNTDSLYHIMNYTQEEIIKASMDYSKTATVNDWDKRTYDINITASSKTTFLPVSSPLMLYTLSSIISQLLRLNLYFRAQIL
mgnify:CR=1 FL=1